METLSSGKYINEEKRALIVEYKLKSVIVYKYMVRWKNFFLGFSIIEKVVYFLIDIMD